MKQIKTIEDIPEEALAMLSDNRGGDEDVEQPADMLQPHQPEQEFTEVG